MSKQEFESIYEFSKDKQTPCLILNLNRVEKRYEELVRNLTFAKIFYAVKANLENDIVSALAMKGSNFDVATVYEMDQLFGQGISADRMSYGNTIKKEKDIAYAYKKGIRLFSTDSLMDLEKIARSAPGSKVFVRFLSEGKGADWPLSKKFGATKEVVIELLIKAQELGLVPYGVSFHVGSQQRDINQWDFALADCKYVFDAVKEKGIELKLINMGGGFPTTYIKPTEEISRYAETIKGFLNKYFGENLPEIIIEPGRSLVGDCGVLISEVVLVSKKSKSDNYNWVYVDIGKFGGLAETDDESIKYPIFLENDRAASEMCEVVLAGPTCDSADVLYEKFKYVLPADLKEGERLYFVSTGAYTASYSAVGFNGFPPLKVYVGRF